MSEQDRNTASGGFHWSASAPDDSGDDEGTPLIGRVALRADEYAGPFRDDDGPLSDDFDWLHLRLGISRQLFDDAIAWNEEFAALRSEPSADWNRDHFARQQDLLRRLHDEVHPGIEVESPRSRPRRLVQMRSLGLDPESGRLIASDEAGGCPSVLPPLPDALTQRVIAWIEAARRLDSQATDDAAIFAWEDEGSAIERELTRALGEDYEVVAR